MNETYDYFKKFTLAPDTLFSADNPALKSVGKAHRSAFEAFDAMTRSNLALASDLLDLNRKRIEAFYEGKPLADQLHAQSEIVFEGGQRVVEWTDELRDAGRAFRRSVADLASEAAEPAQPAKKSSRKTAKAA